MIRLLHLLAITGLIASAGYAYSTKYEALYYAETLAKMRSKLQREREAIAVSKAEWAMLNRPDRLQKIVDAHLDLVPMTIGQLARLSSLPVKAPKGDEIGRKLELLGLEALVSPKDKRPAEARAPVPAKPPAR